MKTTALITPHLIASLKPRAKEYTLYDAQCSGLAIRVQPTGAMAWVTWLRANGKTRRVTLAKLDALSPDAARKMQRTTVATGAGTAGPHRACLTFNALPSAFVTDKRGVYKQRTLESLQIYLRNQLRPAFGALRMNQITTYVLLRLVLSILRHIPGRRQPGLGTLHHHLQLGTAPGPKTVAC